MRNAFSVNLLCYVSDQMVVAQLQPWSGVNPQVRRAPVTSDLLDEFLSRRTFQKNFCRKLFNLARQRSVAWETRCLAILMAEHQILKLRPEHLAAFDFVFTELHLKALGLDHDLNSAVL